MKEEVLLGLSGGVDSAVAAHLLQSKDYHVEGAYCIMSDLHLSGLNKARLIAEELGIKLHELDLRNEFYETIIAPFCEAYNNGYTPSPCVICNPLVKFKALIEKADYLSIPFIATGHYAKVIQEESGFTIAVSSDISKDQSYMLYRLSQTQLSRLILPLEEFSKIKTREIASALRLSNHNDPDSEENCFIPDKKYRDFIARHLSSVKAGNFILPNGETKPHKGVFNYTIGQRSGLGISYKEPLYVKQIHKNGDIILCTSGQEYFSKIIIEDIVMNPNFNIHKGDSFQAKVRSAAKPQNCIIDNISDSKITLYFPDNVRAPAPGQSAVLYRDNKIALGGIISAVVDS